MYKAMINDLVAIFKNAIALAPEWVSVFQKKV